MPNPLVRSHPSPSVPGYSPNSIVLLPYWNGLAGP